MNQIKLNEEQDLAFNDILTFISNGNHREEYYCLSGKAGTGKSTSLAKVVEALPRRRFVVAAISHKAKENIYERINGNNVEPMTIAGLLGMKMNPETGEFVKDDYATDIPIADSDIVIVDEASMMHEEAVDYIMRKKLHRCVVIFAGDEGQIRPIRDKPKLNDLSPVFGSKNKSLLLTRVRQGEGNPILEDMDYYWNATKNLSPNLNNLQRPDKQNDQGSIIYRSNMRQVIEDNIELFKEAIATGNTNLVKIVTARNDIRAKINRIVRKLVWGENPPEYVQGDLMIMQDSYKTEDDLVENSIEFVILNAIPTKYDIDEYSFNAFNITGLASNGRRLVMPVISKEDKEMFGRLCTKLFTAARNEVGVKRKRAFENAWEVAKFFAQAEHGYSISAHRSQGSTYDNVIVNLTDMLTFPTNKQEIASLIYTGGTRARKNVIMVNKEFINPETN